MKLFKEIFAALLILASTGCAFQQQAVRVQPILDVAPTTIGQGRTIKISVVDERPKTTLGTRGARGVGAELTIDGDLTSIVRTVVEEGLQRHGFNPSSSGEAAATELRVEIRSLDYGINVGFWAGALKTDCSLKAICKKGDARPYEKLHRGEFEESVQVVQGKEANDHYVSSAVSKAVSSLLNDRELLDCLAD